METVIVCSTVMTVLEGISGLKAVTVLVSIAVTVSIIVSTCPPSSVVVLVVTEVCVTVTKSVSVRIGKDSVAIDVELGTIALEELENVEVVVDEGLTIKVFTTVALVVVV